MKQFIIGTDWWSDCDDAVAMRILARAHIEKRIFVHGIAINACMEDSAASLDAFLKLEGVDDIPLGIDLEATDFGGTTPYQKRLSVHAERYKDNNSAESAVRLYRRILASVKEKIDIIEIGFLQAIAAAIDSPADDISPKSGLELFSEKVSKIWIMAGKWDADGEKENNFARTPRSRVAGAKFCEICPVPVTFLGWEAGYDVISGSRLSKTDHLYQVLCDHGSASGRCSWDPMVVMMALIGDASRAGYDEIHGTATVDPSTGANHFKVDENGLHSYVIKNQPNNYYADMIDNEISSLSIE